MNNNKYLWKNKRLLFFNKTICLSLINKKNTGQVFIMRRKYKDCGGRGARIWPVNHKSKTQHFNTKIATKENSHKQPLPRTIERTHVRARQSSECKGAKPNCKKMHNEYSEHLNRHMNRPPTQKTTQVATTIFKVSADHKRPFESKQPITNRIHKVAMVLKFQSQSKSNDKQRT